MITLKTKNWTINNIDTILFDKDGTFVDLHYFWGKMTELRALEVIERFSLSKDNFFDICLALGYDVNSKKMLSDGITALYSRSKIIQLFKDDLQRFGVDTTEEELATIFDFVSENFYNEIEKYIKPIPEAVDFIKKVFALGVKLGIVTSDSVVSTKLSLQKYNWEYLFSSVVGREFSLETKESGALTKIALAELGANPVTTVMIGDAPMDYFAAKNAGVPNTILVASGQISENSLKETSPFVVESLLDVEIFLS